MDQVVKSHILHNLMPGGDFQAGRSFYPGTTGGSFFSRNAGDWNLVLLCSGEGSIQIEGKIHPIRKGDFLIRRHDYGCRFDFEPGSDVFWIGMVPKPDMLGIGERWQTPLDGLLCIALPPREFRRARSTMIECLAIDLDRKPGYFPLVYSLAESLVWRAEFLSQQHFSTIADAENGGIAFALRLLSRLENEDSAEEIARKCGFSRAAFFRKFREATGGSPHAYREKLRFRQARNLLSSTNLPLSAIAMQCHLGEQSYFSSRFKQLFHMTPNRFRKQNSIFGADQPIEDLSAPNE